MLQPAVDSPNAIPSDSLRQLTQGDSGIAPTLWATAQEPMAGVADSLSPTEGFTQRLEASFAQVAEFVPALFGALVLLFVGYLVARLIEKGVYRLLRKLRFNELLDRGGVLHAVERAGTHVNPSRIVANLLFWMLMFAVMLVAANAIGLESLANVFSELVSYIPSVIAAIVIIIVGIVLGGFVGGLIMASAASINGGPTLARVGRGGVIVLAVFMALQELGIATDIVTTAFAILFGAVAFALAVAFGLGNRDLAGEITRSWYSRYKAEQEAIEREVAAEEAEEEAEVTRDAEAPPADDDADEPVVVRATPARGVLAKLRG
jgi:hypothetical protein